MFKAIRTGKKFRRINLMQIIFAIAIIISCVTFPVLNKSWKARSEYDQNYSKLLKLPNSIASPIASMRRMPGVEDKALWIYYYQPKFDDDATTRNWFVEHGGFSEFKSLDRNLPKPIGAWKAERGSEFLIMSRTDENGWVHLSYGTQMTPEDAKKDLATFPWKSETDALRR